MNTPAPATLRHWTLVRDADDLAWLALDCADRRVNVLSAEVMTELGLALDALSGQPPRGLVIRSGKPGHFMAGADIEEFAGLTDAESVRRFVGRGWDLHARVSALPYPTLALIRGACLGGGLELALACRHRLACDDADTVLGLPEVMLGIVPGWGGMLRLPALVGAPAALDLMLGGRPVDARRAAALGLVDARVPPRLLDEAARRILLERRPRHRASLPGMLTNRGPLKALIAAGARRRVAGRDPRGHYPAPRAIIDIWQRHGGDPRRAPALLQALLDADTTHSLLRVFRLRERLQAFARAGATEEDVAHVHVVGAGVMGGDIAAWCALRGLQVTLQDQDMARVAQAVGRAAQQYARRLPDSRDVRAALDRLIPDAHGHGVARADVVIEAIVEDADAKRALYARLEPRLRPDALLATNTSSLSLASLRAGLARPERLVGLHFFNPVSRMPLVEVVGADGDPPALGARACAFAGRLGKLPLPVRDAPGFLVNAVLAPYLLAAMQAVDQGLAPETVDAALRDYGMAMGPLELADTIGLDIALAAGRQLADAAQPPACLARHVARGELGRKSGRGFYDWQDGKPVRRRTEPPPAGLAERLLQPLVERARRQVAAGVVDDADLADAGLVFGAGYAPATGGPLHRHRNLPPAASPPQAA